MGAKETVLNEDEINAWMNDEANTCLGEGLVIGDLMKRQAEISFKAGIREVVEWLEQISKAGQPSRFIPSSEWQAKLKEWGIA